MRKVAGIAVAALLLGACAPTSVLLESEHVSHPFVGPPFSPRTDEAGLTHASVLLRWRMGGADRVQGYVDAGLGANLQGSCGGGFYGPTLTGTVRAGLEIPIKK